MPWSIAESRAYRTPSPLSPRRTSTVLAKIYQVANPHHLMPHWRQPSVISNRCRVPRIPQTSIWARANVLLALPLTRLWLSVCLCCSPSISSSTFNMTHWYMINLPRASRLQVSICIPEGVYALEANNKVYFCCHISFVHNIICHAITVFSGNISTRVAYK
jgi:hypothetical protein